MFVLSYRDGPYEWSPLSKNNTFAVADSMGGVQFTYDADVDPYKATMSGIVQHVSEDGTGFSGGYYAIEAEFTIGQCNPCQTPSNQEGTAFNNGAEDPWYGSNPVNGLYQDIFKDLLNNSSANETPNNDPNYSTAYDRIYIDMTDLSITGTPVSGPDSYGGPLVWDEAPNGPNNLNKQFFFQTGHRGEDGISGVGWLDAPNQGKKVSGASDFLFTLNMRSGPGSVPEPSSLALLGLGLAAAAFRRRRA